MTSHVNTGRHKGTGGVISSLEGRALCCLEVATPSGVSAWGPGAQELTGCSAPARLGDSQGRVLWTSSCLHSSAFQANRSASQGFTGQAVQQPPGPLEPAADLQGPVGPHGGHRAAADAHLGTA